MGQNPTSGLLSLSRRREIYAICQKFDVLIIEDDPYWYLQYPSANTLSVQARGKPVSDNFPQPNHNYHIDSLNGKSSGYPFLDSLVPSYLNIDIDGRVIRLDTFSKTIAPGCRLGWITAQPMIVDYILRITETSTQQPSGFVQSLVAELIMGPQSESTSVGGKGETETEKGWKVDGWVRWLEGLRGNYERRMQIMSQTLEEGKYLISHTEGLGDSASEEDDSFQVITKTQLYEFEYPLAGMFLWLRTRLETHPLFHEVHNHERLARALWVFLTTEPFLCLVAPGTMFSPTDQIRVEKGWQYFRLCFAAVEEDKVKLHSQHVADALRAFWTIKDVKKIDEILKDDEDAPPPMLMFEVRFDTLDVSSLIPTD